MTTRVRDHFTGTQKMIPVLDFNPIPSDNLHVGRIVGLINPESHETKPCDHPAYIADINVTNTAFLTNDIALPNNIDDFFINFMTLGPAGDGPLMLSNFVRMLIEVIEERPEALSVIEINGQIYEGHMFQNPLAREPRDTIFIIAPKNNFTKIIRFRDRAIAFKIGAVQNEGLGRINSDMFGLGIYGS